ncbi:hypothetical protein SCHPADRAFT_341346 [Schizopora paradoxa]|uniref:Uncharacterized protein n=1 Tax=Schizopora paradoxa TaxID=27342 RepID=A0A0H2RPT1_9AGAM|nr:hypothetical protein SCHPADRAFT_341346 [Schizopora paradoxa]
MFVVCLSISYLVDPIATLGLSTPEHTEPLHRNRSSFVKNETRFGESFGQISFAISLLGLQPLDISSLSNTSNDDSSLSFAPPRQYSKILDDPKCVCLCAIPSQSSQALPPSTLFAHALLTLS